jgi:hypothetical protein
LFVAFQPKLLHDVVVAKWVHASAKYWLVRQISSWPC